MLSDCPDAVYPERASIHSAISRTIAANLAMDGCNNKQAPCNGRLPIIAAASNINAAEERVRHGIPLLPIRESLCRYNMVVL